MSPAADLTTAWRPVADRVIAARLRQAPRLEHDDIRSDGYLGLLRATETWRPDLGPAEAHVGYRVNAAISDGYRIRHGRLGSARRSAQHVPLERDDLEGLAPIDVLTQASDSDLDTAAARADEHRVRGLLSRLPPRERLIVRETFLRGRTLRALAEQLGVTEGRISQIRTAALRDVVRDRTCAGCRATFTPHDYRQRFCGRPCQRATATARHLGKIQQPDGTWAYPHRSCRACGQTFVVHNPRKLFCSKACQQRQTPRAARNCPVCRTRFVPKNDQRLYCGDRCYRYQSNLNDKRRKA